MTERGVCDLNFKLDREKQSCEFAKRKRSLRWRWRCWRGSLKTFTGVVVVVGVAAVAVAAVVAVVARRAAPVPVVAVAAGPAAALGRVPGHLRRQEDRRHAP